MCHILRTLAGIGEIDEVYAYCSDERICEYLPEACVSCAAAPASTATRRSGGRSTTVSRPTSRPTSTCWRTPPRRSSDRKPLPTHCGTCARGVRLGVQRREDPDLCMVRWPAAQLCAGRHPPHADHRAGLYRDQRIFHFPAHALVRPRTPHRGKTLHGCRRPHRRAGHRQPRRLYDGRDHRGKAGGWGRERESEMSIKSDLFQVASFISKGGVTPPRVRRRRSSSRGCG